MVRRPVRMVERIDRRPRRLIPMLSIVVGILSFLDFPEIMVRPMMKLLETNVSVPHEQYTLSK
jgi:hypothetical protein